jgi:hypothetical protein
VRREVLKRRKKKHKQKEKKSIARMTWDKKDGRIEDCQPPMGEKDEKKDLMWSSCQPPMDDVG